MKFNNTGAELYIPDGTPEETALSRTTHLAISAHQDDIEIMAADGILKCFGKKEDWFTAIIVTNGAGSPRDGLYASYTDEEMRAVRKVEQKKAAFVGEYGAALLLDYTSSEAKDPGNDSIAEEIKSIVMACKPEVIYTHNLADKHDTHVGTAVKVIRALRELPPEFRPAKLYGCEVWRNLDWMNDDEKVMFDVSAHPNIAAALVEVFDSQVCGGKRYDLATAGRRIGNATYSASHGTDEAAMLSYGMDLTPLIEDTTLDIKQYVLGYISRFSRDVSEKISKATGC